MNAEFGMINENGEDERDRKVVDSNKTQPADEARSVHDASPPPKRIADLKSEVERLENDDTASEMDLTRARLEYGIELAGYPQFGDAETPLSSVRWNLVETQACVKTLVEVLRTNNKFPEAQRLYDRALRGVCRSRGRHHPWTLELQNNLACLHAAVGEVEVAEKLFKKSSKGKGIVFGNEHLTTLKTQWNLTLVSFRRHQEKSSQFSDQLDLPSLVRIYRGEDADFQSLAKQLCYVYSQTGRQGRAAKLCEEFTVDLVPQAEDPCHFYEDNLIPSVDTEHRSPVASSEQPDALTALREGLDWLGPRGASYLVGAFARTRKAIVKRAESSTPTLVVERLSKWVGKITSPSIGPANLWGFLAYLEDPKILLEQAAGTGQEDLVKLLLTAWPKPNISNDAEMSALLGALKKGIESRNVLVLQQFLEHGNYANSRGESKQIPLHIAAEVGCEDAFRTLLMAGSEASTRDARGDTPLDLALRRNHESIIRVMMVERHALISSSNGSVLPAHDGEKVEYTEADYTGLDATIVDFYTDLPHKAEEHRVRKEQLEKIISNPEILSQILCNDEDQDGYAPANFTWIHMPANNMEWIEVLMENMARLGADKAHCMDFLTHQFWHNRLQDLPNTPLHARCMKPLCQRLDNGCASSGLVVFMPYVHWELEHHKREMDLAIKNARLNPNEADVRQAQRDEGEPASKPASYFSNSKADKRLLTAYLGEPRSRLHVRRTLDQFQYSMKHDTEARDFDQVVSRYYRRVYPGKPVPIMMIDQLWLWIVDERTIITCFPKLWGKPNTLNRRTGIIDTRNLLDSILEHLQNQRRVPVGSVVDLSRMIIARCLDLNLETLDWKDGTEKHPHLEVFEQSINRVADEETELFDHFAKFNARSKKGGQAPKKIKAKMGGKNRGRNEDETQANTAGEIRDRKYPDALGKDLKDSFSISREIELMKEIKDIRDELNILRKLIDQQKEVIDSFCGQLPGECQVLQTAVERLDSDVIRMDRDAKRPYEALEELVNLKQKQANIEEARIARVSGNTITVFTIVTIIFLPASFMAAFLALPVVQYRLVDNKMELGFAVKWTAIVTVALGIPFTIFAIYVNPILRLVKLLGGRLNTFWRQVSLGMVLTWKALSVLPIVFRIFWIILRIMLSKRELIWKWWEMSRKAKRESRRDGKKWSIRDFVIGSVAGYPVPQRSLNPELP